MPMCRSRSNQFLLSSALLMLVCWTSTVQAQDATSGTIVNSSDTASAFSASGTYTTEDKPNVVDGGLGPGNEGLGPGPPFEIRPTLAPGAERKWVFDIRHEGSWNAAGADDASICISGQHLKGPHPPEPPAGTNDKNPNVLYAPTKLPNSPGLNLEGCFQKTTDINFGVAGTKPITHYGRKPHALTGNKGNHYDHWVLRAAVTAIAGTGMPNWNTLTGAYQVGARHTRRSSKPARLIAMAIGSSDDAGTFVNYDAATSSLTWAVGSIDILDGIGGFSRAVAPEYALDTVLNGQVNIESMILQGQVDGSYTFSGGLVTITDPSGVFDFTGEVGNYLIGSTVPNGDVVQSRAIFTWIKLVDDPPSSPSTTVASLFLDDFVDENLLAESLSPEEQTLRDGVMLVFYTETDLVAATSGFTTSASLPATVVIGASQVVASAPGLSNWALGLLVGAILASARFGWKSRRR